MTVHRIRALGGYLLEAPDGDHIGNEVSQGRPYEPWVLRVTARLAGDGTVLDVGAHVGNHTIYLAKSGAHVVAVEPHPETFRVLQSNVERNGLDDQVELVKAACGAASGRASITVPNEANTGSAKIAVGCGPIKVVTVDSMELSPAVVKIDVEGSEDGVIAGSVETLRRYRPALICESHDGAIDGLLKTLGYRKVGWSLARSPTFLYVPSRRMWWRTFPMVAAVSVRSSARRAVTRSGRLLRRLSRQGASFRPSVAG